MVRNVGKFEHGETKKLIDNDMLLTTRIRVAIADINAGLTLLSAIQGYKYRVVDCSLIAVGGAVAAATSVDISGTQGGVVVKLLTAAVAALTQSAVARMGGTNMVVLADGASFAACDADTAITIGKTGGTATTATNVDVLLSYTIEQ